MLVDVTQVKTPIKPKAYSTMCNMRKDDLIDYIRTLEHNYNVAMAFNQQQAENFLAMNPGWISVKERLPEETGSYLVHDISMGIRVFYFGKGEVRSGWFGVTHWMPLPEPPEEG